MLVVIFGKPRKNPVLRMGGLVEIEPNLKPELNRELLSAESLLSSGAVWYCVYGTEVLNKYEHRS
jgi:hypothetical protein